MSDKVRRKHLNITMTTDDHARVLAAAKAADKSASTFGHDIILEAVGATPTTPVRIRVQQQRGTDYWTYHVLDEHGGMYLASGPFHNEIDARKNAVSMFGKRVEWV